MFKITQLVKILMVSCLAFATTSFAGSSEEELKYEISFLAKKLLDMSGEDSITVEQSAFMKPFIGICSDVSTNGIKLTCITPGHNASKAGLKTGDLITAINNIDMTSSNKSAFYMLTKSMKTGDELAIKLLRKGNQKVIKVTVGSIGHPAYSLTVKK